jgi:hypothetical protein
MKITLPLLLAAACGVPLIAPLDAGAQTNQPPLPAVIVIRHGDDIKGSWPTNKADVKTWSQKWAPNWPNYTLPNGSNVQVRMHGLSSNGEGQAKWLAENLPALLKKEGVNFMPITRVVTKDPWTKDGKDDPTPNPFDTAWPFIKNNSIQDVVLVPAKKGINPYGPRANKTNETVDEGLLKMLPCYHGSITNAKPSDSIFPTNASGQITGSTLVVWDGQGMWGPHQKEPDIWYWADDTEQKTDKPVKVVGANVLRLLGGKVIGDHILNEPQAGKAKRLYMFYPRYGREQGDKSDDATSDHIKLYGTNVPEYDVMVWDILMDENKSPTGWKNVVNIEVDEPAGLEIIEIEPRVN